MNFTGERVVFDKMKGSLGDMETLQHHISRYMWALPFVHNKKVMDAACGTGYGTWLLSLSAKHVLGADISDDAVNYANKKFFNDPDYDEAICEIVDLNEMTSPYPEVQKMIDDRECVVSFETIEHLEHPENFLREIKAPELIFSVPIDHHGEYHKHIYRTENDIVKLLIRTGWKLKFHQIQKNRFFLGIATRE